MKYQLISATPSSDGQILIAISVTTDKGDVHLGGGTVSADPGDLSMDEYLAGWATHIAADLAEQFATTLDPAPPPTPIDVSKIQIDPKVVDEARAALVEARDNPTPEPTPVVEETVAQ